MRVLGCGGRYFHDQARLNKTLNTLYTEHTISCVIHGAAPGADTLGGTWAIINHIAVERYPADWDKIGKVAGPARNREMLETGKPDLCVACPGDFGTVHMIGLCERAGVPILFA